MVPLPVRGRRRRSAAGRADRGARLPGGRLGREADDWEPTNSTDVVAAKVIDGVTAHGDGAVVLQHTWPNQTLGAIPAIVAALRERGATFVAVDELGSLPTQHAD